MGRIGQNPELKQTVNGNFVCKTSIATNDSYKNKDGEHIDDTQWHNLVFWNRLAEVAGKHLTKGNLVLIEGKLKNHRYEKEGIIKYFSEVTVQKLIMLDKTKKPVD